MIENVSDVQSKSKEEGSWPRLGTGTRETSTTTASRDTFVTLSYSLYSFNQDIKILK